MRDFVGTCGEDEQRLDIRVRLRKPGEACAHYLPRSRSQLYVIIVDGLLTFVMISELVMNCVVFIAGVLNHHWPCSSTHVE